MAEQDNVRVLREVFDAWNQHDANRLMKLVDEKFIGETDTLPAPIVGRSRCRGRAHRRWHIDTDLCSLHQACDHRQQHHSSWGQGISQCLWHLDRRQRRQRGDALDGNGHAARRTDGHRGEKPLDDHTWVRRGRGVRRESRARLELLGYRESVATAWCSTAGSEVVVR